MEKKRRINSDRISNSLAGVLKKDEHGVPKKNKHKKAKAHLKKKRKRVKKPVAKAPVARDTSRSPYGSTSPKNYWD